MKLSDDLRQSVLQAAMEGKLTKQLKEDGNADDLLKVINEERAKLVKEKKIKKSKPLPQISEDEIPFDIPANWRWVKLENIGDWMAGATPLKSHNEYYNGNIPWLKTGDLNDEYINKTSECITKIGFKNSSVRLNPKGSVLMAMYGATIGKLGILNIPSTTNQACCACICFDGIYNKYLFYYLMSQRKQFISLGAGGAQPNISKQKIINYAFPLPPLAEQHRIVEKVDALMAEIDELEKKENELEKLKKEFPEDMKESLLQAALSGKLTKQSKDKKVAFVSKKQKEEADFEIPESWAFANISEVSKNIPSKKYQINTSEIKKEGRYPVISQSKDFISGYSNLSDKLLHVEEPIVMFGDHTTEVKYIDFDFIVGADGTKLFQCKKDLILSKYFAYVLTYYSLGLQRKGGYSRHYKFIKNKAVPLPPLEEQTRIVEKLDELLSLCNGLKQA